MKIGRSQRKERQLPDLLLPARPRRRRWAGRYHLSHLDYCSLSYCFCWFFDWSEESKALRSGDIYEMEWLVALGQDRLDRVKVKYTFILYSLPLPVLWHRATFQRTYFGIADMIREREPYKPWMEFQNSFCTTDHRWNSRYFIEESQSAQKLWERHSFRSTIFKSSVS